MLASFVNFLRNSITRHIAGEPVPDTRGLITSSSVAKYWTTNGITKTEVDTISNRMAKIPCEEKRNIYFIKTHKTGGTTVCNILCRFGLARKLYFGLSNIRRFGDYSHIAPHTVNVFAHHADYNETTQELLMGNGTAFITILREPFRQFVSAAVYYNTVIHLDRHAGTRVEEKISSYLATAKIHNSFLSNKMGKALGFTRKHYLHKPSAIGHLNSLNKKLDLVMILGYWFESLILLRRHLCLRMRDILFRKALPETLNTRLNSQVEIAWFNKSHRQLHKTFSPLDYMIYDHFLSVFREKVMLQTQYFHEEVNYLRKITERLENYCQSGSKKPLIIAESFWHQTLTLAPIDCYAMLWSDVKFHMYIRKLQIVGPIRKK